MEILDKQDQLKYLELAFNALEAYFKKHDKIPTYYGEQYTVYGYHIGKIVFQDNWIQFSIFMLDRFIREKDICVRRGDRARFLYHIDKNEIILQEDQLI